MLFLLHVLARPCCHISPNPGQFLQSVSEGLLGGCCGMMGALAERNIVGKLKFVMFFEEFCSGISLDTFILKFRLINCCS